MLMTFDTGLTLVASTQNICWWHQDRMLCWWHWHKTLCQWHCHTLLGWWHWHKPLCQWYWHKTHIDNIDTCHYDSDINTGLTLMTPTQASHWHQHKTLCQWSLSHIVMCQWHWHTLLCWSHWHKILFKWHRHRAHVDDIAPSIRFIMASSLQSRSLKLATLSASTGRHCPQFLQ